MNPEIKRPGEAYFFVKEMACKWIEESTRAYFATDPNSHLRLERVVAVEDSQKIAQLMGVSMPEIIKAYLRGTPEKFRQDYLNTIYDEGVLFGGDTVEIAHEFNLVEPTLGL